CAGCTPSCPRSGSCTSPTRNWILRRICWRWRRATASCSLKRVLRKYKEQSQVERRIHHLKGPLAVTPMFLEKPERIAGLLCILTPLPAPLPSAEETTPVFSAAPPPQARRDSRKALHVPWLCCSWSS